MSDSPNNEPRNAPRQADVPTHSEPAPAEPSSATPASDAPVQVDIQPMNYSGTHRKSWDGPKDKSHISEKKD